VLESLWQEVDDHIKQEICPELPVKLMQRTMYLLLKELASQGVMAISEWQAKASLEMLNRAPFHELIELADNQIILDRERLLQSRPEEMYAWHYEILQAVKSEL
jgi:hypothetical protein